MMDLRAPPTPTESRKKLGRSRERRGKVETEGTLAVHRKARKQVAR